MHFLPVTSPKVSAVLCVASGFIFGSTGYSNDADRELQRIIREILGKQAWLAMVLAQDLVQL